jgi:WD40 repeat protein
VVGGGDNVVRVLDASNGAAAPPRPAGHQAAVRGVAISADGQTVATVGQDSTVRLWRTATGEPLRRFPSDEAKDLAGCAFSPTAAVLATWENRAVPTWPGGLSLWDAERVEERHRIELANGHVREAVFSPDGKTLAAACTNNHARLWNVATGKLVKEIAHDSPVNAAALTPDGKVLATIDAHLRIRLWDVGTGKQGRLFEGNTDTFRICGFTPDGKTLITDSPLKRVFALWEVATGALRQRQEYRSNSVQGAALSPSGKVLATGGFDGVIRLWALPGGKELRRLEGHSAAAVSLAFSRDGRRLVSGSWDTTALIWDVSDLRGVKE